MTLVERWGQWKIQHCGGRNANGVGYDFQDGGVFLLDVRFADGILMFLKSREEIGQAFDMLVPLGKVAPNPGATMAQSEHPAG